MSREGREIVDRYHLGAEAQIIVDDILLRQPRGIMYAYEGDALKYALHQLLTRPAVLPDAPSGSLLDHEDAYRYICGEYLTHDFNRINLLKIAAIVTQYPFEVIKRVGHRCKANANFTLPYLATALENEGAAEIEAIRRDQRLDELVSQSKPVELPTRRFPGELRARLHEKTLNDEIERLNRGD